MEDKVDTICTFQSILSTSPCSKAFLYILPIFYKTDLLDEESILKWFHEKEPGSYESQIKPFIEWLESSSDVEEEDE